MKTASCLLIGLAGCALLAPPSKTPEDRVQRARMAKGKLVRRLVHDAGLHYPPKSLYLRAFKREGQLELWAADAPDQAHRLLKTYRIAAMSGGLGPKRREGDQQVPEGFYSIDRFNPYSSFHLSLGLNYPNASDRNLSDRQHPGGDIFIHGSNVSIGCLAMTDDKIKEIYLLALDARTAGQRSIPVHIFPARMDDQQFARLRSEFQGTQLPAFWASLRGAYLRFERTHKVPIVKTQRNGTYTLVSR